MNNEKIATIEFCGFDNIKITPNNNNSDKDYFEKSNFFPNGNVLLSDKNNNSKTWPVMVCNLDNKMNDAICNRNFPDESQTIIPDYRSGVKVCEDYRYENLYNNINTNVIKNTNNISSNLVPGKGEPKQYLENIDVESLLFNMNNKINKKDKLIVSNMFSNTMETKKY